MRDGRPELTCWRHGCGSAVTEQRRRRTMHGMGKMDQYRTTVPRRGVVSAGLERNDRQVGMADQSGKVEAMCYICIVR